MILKNILNLLNVRKKAKVPVLTFNLTDSTPDNLVDSQGNNLTWGG
jgi:hypothetical protein